MDSFLKMAGYTDDVRLARYEQLKAMVDVASSANFSLSTINGTLEAIARGDIDAETIRQDPEGEFARLVAILTLARETAICLRDQAQRSQQDIATILDMGAQNARLFARVMVSCPTDPVAAQGEKDRLHSTVAPTALSIAGPTLVVDNGGLPN